MRTYRHLFLTCLCMLTLHAVYAQDSTLCVGTKSDETDLNAVCYKFPQRVETFSVSKNGDYLCISFRETTKKTEHNVGIQFSSFQQVVRRGTEIRQRVVEEKG